MEFLGFSVSILAIVIGYSQWMTADQRVRIELFNKRIEIYQTFQDAMLELVETGKASDDGTRNLLIAANEARWVFDESIHKYLKGHVFEDYLQVKAKQSLIEDDSFSNLAEERIKLAQQKTELVLKMLTHLEDLPNVCGPMLRIQRKPFFQVILDSRASAKIAWAKWFELES